MILILKRADLPDAKQRLSIEELTLSDFPYEKRLLSLRSTVVVFVEKSPTEKERFNYKELKCDFSSDWLHKWMDITDRELGEYIAMRVEEDLN